MILEGTTSTGAVVPVQVTTDGKVVAEGMTGSQGPQGPEGPQGPQGPEGPAGSPGNLWSGSDPGPISYTGGSVGIGTSSPSETLTVAGNIDLPNVNTYIKGGGHNVVQVDATKTYLSGGTGGVQFRTADNSLPLVDITNAGRVGIGTALPATLLHVSGVGTQALFEGGTDQNAGIRMRPNGAAVYSQIFFDNAAGTSSSSILCSGGATLFIDTASNGDIYHRTNGTGNHVWTTNGGAEAARIDSSGRLLVGTTTAPPGTVAGDVVSNGGFCLKSPDGNWWSIEVDNSGTLSASLLI